MLTGYTNKQLSQRLLQLTQKLETTGLHLGEYITLVYLTADAEARFTAANASPGEQGHPHP